MSRRISTLCLALFLLAPVAAQAQYICPPVVVAPAPVVSYYAPAPVVSYYAPAPTVSYYAPAPAVSYYAPAVAYASPTTVTSYRYGLLGLRRLDVVSSGSAYVAPAAVVPARSYYVAPRAVIYP
jgi:hypothetical protein